MSYLIDGHNLIPHVRGMSLAALDDESQLIELLQAFCRAEQRSVEVFFDKAPPGRSGTRRYGRVTAHFVPEGRTADSAIAARLRRLKRAAANWSVVSSDRQVQAEARSHQARTLGSDAFARLLEASAARSGREIEKPDPQKPLSEDEVEEWMKLFQSKKGRRP